MRIIIPIVGISYVYFKKKMLLCVLVRLVDTGGRSATAKDEKDSLRDDFEVISPDQVL